MSETPKHFDFVIIGSGPAGQRAAVSARSAGRSVCIIEEQAALGGACVQTGTIPSKTLREVAFHLSSFRARVGSAFDTQLGEEVQVSHLMARLEEVVEGHVRVVCRELEQAGVVTIHGRGRFLSDSRIEVLAPGGKRTEVTAERVLLATGSRPRTPPEVAIDHEHIFDSDSILSIIYLPRTLIVLGAGVIACEYASIFSALGVRVTIVDRGSRPLPFVDAELTDRWLSVQRARNLTYLGGCEIESVLPHDAGGAVVKLRDGRELQSDKVLCALGRVANLERLNLSAVGLAPNARGLIEVDQYCRTRNPRVYAIGDIIGPPSLASAAIEQGRRAVHDALDRPLGQAAHIVPMGIYTIPEISTVGLSVAEAEQKYGGAIVGTANFCNVARGLINGNTDGICKLVADPTGKKLLGAHLFGDGATELIHVAQMALFANAAPDIFVDNIFNFPTLAEVYRHAALAIIAQRK